MWILNRKTRYEIIKNLIETANPGLIHSLVLTYGFDDSTIDDIEKRRKQLLDYLDEMEKCWTDHFIDMTDRQYMKVDYKNTK